MIFDPQNPSLSIGIVGSGAMGRGIAQIAAQAGVSVKLYDANAAASAAARKSIGETLEKLVTKGKVSAGDALATTARIKLAASLDDLASCELVVEAIVENLEVKRELFRALEAIVGPETALVSNTSSLSITAIAATADHPERIAGWHFFNPVPLMKVVEVIDGLRTDPALSEALMALSRRLGHTPVRAKDTPGFIVNHAGRGFGTEALRIIGEGVCSFSDVDRVMREAAGFRLGPFELMDLTALDVSHPVMESIYHQYYEEPRFRPSVITAQRLAGGLVGRKSGRGFYDYSPNAQAPFEATAPTTLPASIWISPRDALARATLITAFEGIVPVTVEHTTAELCIVTPFGQDATSLAVDEGLDARRTVAIDLLTPLALRRTVMTTPVTTAEAREAAHALFGARGHPVTLIRDSGGLIAQRILATVINIACDIAQQQIASPSDIDLAVRLGLNYPHGPLAWGDLLGPARIVQILANMQALSGDPRYRASPWLLRRARLGVSLLFEES